MLTRLTGARVFDPINGIRGEVRDVWIDAGRICAPPRDGAKAAQTIDLSGKERYSQDNLLDWGCALPPSADDLSRFAPEGTTKRKRPRSRD